MHTDAQSFLNHGSTAATTLRRTAWIDLDIRSTSIFRFVARIGGELIPCGIRNAFRQTVIFEQPCDTQVLEHNHAEAVDQFPAFLMGEVLTPVGDPFMNTGNDRTALCSLWRSFWLFAQAALRSLQVAFVGAKETRMSNRLASRKRSKLLKTDSHADRRFWHVASDNPLAFHGKGDEPLTK